MRFGVDYYPEHCPPGLWEQDADMMRELGIEVVRMAEFSWAKMEPEPGVYDFGWLDEAIALLGERGIKTVLGTPTAAPPVWMMELHPDLYPVNAEGGRVSFGGRHHDCQSHPAYRKHIEDFVRTMALRYRDNPHVVGWQIDNELGNSHRDLCYCDYCRGRFQHWLEERHGSIEALNEAWGTVFWSQTYTSFSQIPVPMPTPNSHNPSLLLDWKRFCSSLVVQFQKWQADILREVCPGHFLTHNFMGFFDKTDYFELAKDLDFISHDQYPMLFLEERIRRSSPSHLGMALDLMRGTKGKPFWVMEQLAGPTGTEILGSTPRPGQMRLWTYQSVAHGADAIVYFRWDTCLFGSEQYWHGILPHSRIPGRRYEEIRQSIAELAPHMEAFRGGLPEAEAAIVFSYDQEWALQIQPHHPELNYVAHLHRYYKAFFDQSVPVDLISEHDDFSKYKVLIFPLLFVTDSKLCRKLYDYTEAGGHVLLDMRTGVKDRNNAVFPQTLPGEYAELLGLSIYDYDCLRQFGQGVKWLEDGGSAVSPVSAASGMEDDFDKTYKEAGLSGVAGVAGHGADLAEAEPVGAVGTDGGEGGEGVEEAELWCDIITAGGAEVLAVYNRDFYAGTPAVTRHAYGRGHAYYAGTELGPRMMGKLVREIMKSAGITGIAAAPDGVEIARRRGRDGSYYFVMNHNRTACSFDIPAGWEPVSGDCEGGGSAPGKKSGEAGIAADKPGMAAAKPGLYGGSPESAAIIMQPFDCILFVERDFLKP
ncbi:beta-galactosidase [Paenibacillus sp. HN-1]|uniref:beta-galactosidase n=1 Tax=Paenibacillus TaxID=44249 RepID=UPI001CA890EA|nr:MULTISPECIES: beta-galactosidase [Paenibacillus]MBY9079111.1 beta-galactosidase [Paenibacillus sp. CGMCC 1.18879]MBY9086889.1 beta-galactosidase [Paenibacillus sinensis]